jgi:AcrR family transcriptional regulator
MPYRPTPRTEARRAATRERVLSAALDQLGDGGYVSASIQAIARRAGVATGSVYRHFPSKGELFAEAFRRAAAPELDVVREVTAAQDRPARELIAAAVEAFARRALAQPTRAYALLAEPVDPAVEQERLVFRRGYRDAFVRALKHGIDRRELPPHDTETVAAALVGALGEALVGPLSPRNNGRRGPRPHEALIATLVQFSLDAMPRDPALAVSAAAK